MKPVRTMLLWATLLLTALLCAGSVAGAFLGAERAEALANSAPAALFWAVLLTLLVAGVAFSDKPLRRPGPLAMHAGLVLILLGAMWGSVAGHRLMGRLWGSSKIPGGMMLIGVGQASDEVYDRHAQSARVLGRLPFSLGLERFWIDYYRPHGPWQLWADVRVRDADDGSPQWQRRSLPWKVGQEIPIPGTAAARLQSRNAASGDLCLTVLEYIPSAACVWPEGAEAVLEILPPRGGKLVLPTIPGRTASLEEPALDVTVTRVFRRLIILGQGQQRVIADEPGEVDNPAIEIAIGRPDGTASTVYVLARAGMHPQVEEGVGFRYAASAPASAVPDPSTDLPAMRLLLTRADGAQAQAWLAGRRHLPVGLSVQSVLPAEAPKRDPSRLETRPTGQDQPEVNIVLSEPPPEPSAYNSNVQVLVGQAVAKRAVIGVNRPLHYGGYHFYQTDFDQEAQSYSVFTVTSDSGLVLVYAGFVLVCAGAFWHFWLAPAWRFWADWRTRGR